MFLVCRIHFLYHTKTFLLTVLNINGQMFSVNMHLTQDISMPLFEMKYRTEFIISEREILILILCK